MKIRGREWIDFYNDPKVWPDGAWHESGILVNGRDSVDVDLSGDIRPTDEIEILDGAIYYGDGEGSRSEDIIRRFRRWKKERREPCFMVIIEKERADELKAMIRKFGGKVC